MTLYPFEIQYAYVICYGYKSGYISNMFHVLYNEGCGYHGIVTIDRMIYYCYCLVSIVLTVHTA